MTALFEQVADYLLRWSIWLGALVAMAGAAVATLGWLTMKDRIGHREIVVGGVVGAIVVASLAHRFGVTGPQFAVWRHELPWLWVIIGALAGGAVVVAQSVKRRRGLVTEPVSRSDEVV